MNYSLIILAAGMASRYGGNKQLKGFGNQDETIMEFSIFDAIRAGFTEVVFVIRREHIDFFKLHIEPKIASKMTIKYVFQEMNAFINNENLLLSTRTKPWGTAHALLCCKDIITNPFVVINADDMYGMDSFAKAIDFFKQNTDYSCSIIGYEIENTLSDNGTVSRGVCSIDSNNNLISIKEHLKIFKNKQNLIINMDGDTEVIIPNSTYVSMNFFCFYPTMFTYCYDEFKEFIANKNNHEKSEFFLPLVVDKMIHKYGQKCKFIPCSSRWYGVTYKEDNDIVQHGIKTLILKGEYPEFLWS
ncbi:MAG: sugar phosphate nucleotidyltransferase [Alphaproteobacteria bacterium]|nr:sugar phosphate nucleotidyltransferase [Alphaproteobacteria bacterium]